jgi:hypothetical protein
VKLPHSSGSLWIGEVVYQFFGEAVGKIFLIFAGTHVGKGQHRD